MYFSNTLFENRGYQWKGLSKRYWFKELKIYTDSRNRVLQWKAEQITNIYPDKFPKLWSLYRANVLSKLLSVHLMNGIWDLFENPAGDFVDHSSDNFCLNQSPALKYRRKMSKVFQGRLGQNARFCRSKRGFESLVIPQIMHVQVLRRSAKYNDDAP